VAEQKLQTLYDALGQLALPVSTKKFGELMAKKYEYIATAKFIKR